MTQQSNVTRVKRVLNAVAAGTTSQNGAAVDTQGFQGVRFLIALGAITATAVTTIKVQQGDAANLSDAADLAGSGISVADDGSDDNGVFVVDVYKPAKRYLRVVVGRGTANAVIDGAVAELYEGRTAPQTADASVHGQVLLVSPEEGTP